MVHKYHFLMTEVIRLCYVDFFLYILKSISVCGVLACLHFSFVRLILFFKYEIVYKHKNSRESLQLWNNDAKVFYVIKSQQLLI